MGLTTEPAEQPAVSTDLGGSVGDAASPRSRASWSGLLRFSLVAVPVKAYPATSTATEVHFNQLHADCGQRIRYEKRCPLHGPVAAGVIVGGYAYAPEQYLIVDPAELEQLRPAKDRALVLERFLDAGQVDPVLYAGRTLYLLPDGPGAHHAYTVLAESLRDRRQWAVGRVVLSSRRQLVLVRPTGRILAVHVLHHAEQVRPASVLEGQLRPIVVPDAERQLAAQVLAAGSQPFTWSDFRDDSAVQMRALIESKLQGQPLAPPSAEEPALLSLRAALEQSVAQAIQQEGASAKPLAVARPRRKRAARRSA